MGADEGIVVSGSVGFVERHEHDQRVVDEADAPVNSRAGQDNCWRTYRASHAIARSMPAKSALALPCLVSDRLTNRSVSRKSRQQRRPIEQRGKETHVFFESPTWHPVAGSATSLFCPRRLDWKPVKWRASGSISSGGHKRLDRSQMETTTNLSVTDDKVENERKLIVLTQETPIRIAPQPTMNASIRLLHL